MINYVLLSGNIENIIFKPNSVFFRLKQSTPCYLTINCVTWDSSVIENLKKYKKGCSIKIRGKLKNNNKQGNYNNIIYDYEIVVLEVYNDYQFANSKYFKE